MNKDCFIMNLKCEKSSSIPDWYEIIVAGLPEIYWMQQDIVNSEISRLHSVRRISDACVEGTKAEMLSIAGAIRAKETMEHTRCAVSFEHNKAYFWSPRNSGYKGEVSYEAALKLAEQIEKI